MRKTNKGFTLVELVVVIAIIGVLAAILVPSMLTYVRKARLKTANGNAKTAYNALAEFAADAQIKGTPAATACTPWRADTAGRSSCHALLHPLHPHRDTSPGRSSASSTPR